MHSYLTEIDNASFEHKQDIYVYVVYLSIVSPELDQFQIKMRIVRTNNDFEEKQSNAIGTADSEIS